MTPIDAQSVNDSLIFLKDQDKKINDAYIGFFSDLLSSDSFNVDFDLPVIHQIGANITSIFNVSSSCSDVRIPVSLVVISYDLVIPTCALMKYRVILEWFFYALTVFYLYNVAMTVGSFKVV